MPADLNSPFDSSCCDGGECSISRESARPCGCDRGANHLCDHHRTQKEAFFAGYHAQWIKAEMRWIFDPLMKPGDPEHALEAWRFQEDKW